MKRKWAVVLTLLCLAAQGPLFGQNKGQELNAEDQAKAAAYKTSPKNFFVDEFYKPEHPQNLNLNPYNISYEGSRIFSLFNLADRLNVKEEYEFLQALFENIPQDIPVGTPVRNVVIPRWYKNQDPLVLHVTKAYGRDKIPVLLILFNTPGDIREDGAEAIQKQVPAVSLPRFKNDNGKLSIDAQDYYVLSLLPDGTVTASSAVGKKLPSFESMGEVNDRLNLTDDYLRDGDKTNDNLVLPVLNKIIADEKEKPINRTHAYFQLYMYYLFQGDLKATAATIDQLNGSRLLQNPEVEKTELADAARTELPRIQVLAAALKEKKAPAL